MYIPKFAMYIPNFEIENIFKDKKRCAGENSCTSFFLSINK
jgi:hypothetical protein